MKTVTIRFEEVGRDRRTWTRRFLALPSGEVGEEMIAREARQALSSWDVCAVWDAAGDRGAIFAGAQHVGRFVRVSTEQAPQQEALWL
jgi:hypothetical protein